MTDAARLRPSTDDAVALLAGIGAVAASFAAVGLTPVFLGSPLERFLSRAMPGALVTFAIEQFGSLGQQLNLVLASVLTALVAAVLVRLAIAAGDRLRNRLVPVVVGATLVWALAVLVTGGFTSAASAALGAAAVLVVAAVAPAATAIVGGGTDPARRQVLGAVVATAGLGAIAATQAPSTSEDTGASAPEDASSEVRENLQAAAEQSLGVAGIEPLVSQDFYQVDINAADPNVDAEDWSLSITGEVESEATYALDDIRSMDSRTEFNTLRCVGEPLNGKKTDNALWTGVPTKKLLDRADPNGECDCVKLHAVDDYFQVFPVEALEGGMLAYEMNGRNLPRGHGYPLRALVPGHWGEVQVKWLTEIEFLEREAQGYWEQRGWHGTGPVSTVAKLHAVNDLDDGRKQVAGHAYAGIRGVSAVEVSTDGGDSWNEARLSEPLPSGPVDGDSSGTDSADEQFEVGQDVWRQWAYEYDPPGGSHEVVVRTIETDGTVQTKEEREAFPSGATGWVSKTVQ